MQKVFDSLFENDERARDFFNLKNGVLMENAAHSLAEEIKRRFIRQNGNVQSGKAMNQAQEDEEEENGVRGHITFPNAFKEISSLNKKPVLQIVCGSGDNGGDGLALARMLYDFFEVITVCAKEPKTELCKLQKERLDLLGIKTQNKISASCCILVDALFGTGFKGSVRKEDTALLKKMNSIKAFKIACDIPSGIDSKGAVCKEAFKADLTVSMGALKTAFFSDAAKDFTGKIVTADLGLPRSKYETETDVFLLEKEDFIPPERILKNVHKGNFGHTAVLCGEKHGAAILAALAALKIGAGLVTVCGGKAENLPPDLMYCEELSENFTSFAMGCGLGEAKKSSCINFLKQPAVRKKPLVLDADIFYCRELYQVLPDLEKAVLTPHPKEFKALLEFSGLGKFDVEEIQKNRFEFCRLFYKKYPNLVLVLKGANTLIAAEGKIFINTLGTSALAKAGSGDVLTGITAGLLAQGSSPLSAAVNASLAHAAAAAFTKNTYSLTASALIENLNRL